VACRRGCAHGQKRTEPLVHWVQKTQSTALDFATGAGRFTGALNVWTAPANRGDVLFLEPSLRYLAKRLDFTPKLVAADMAYINMAMQKRLREQLHVGVITALPPNYDLPKKSGAGAAHAMCSRLALPLSGTTALIGLMFVMVTFQRFEGVLFLFKVTGLIPLPLGVAGLVLWFVRSRSRFDPVHLRVLFYVCLGCAFVVLLTILLVAREFSNYRN
jgi:hypothetical protein